VALNTHPHLAPRLKKGRYTKDELYPEVVTIDAMEAYRGSSGVGQFTDNHGAAWK
jgi:hypothetical protein